MARLVPAIIPPKFKNSLAQLGRLDPQGRLIVDETGDLKNVLDEKHVLNERFTTLDLGYLGKMTLIEGLSGASLVSVGVGKTRLREQESLLARIEAEEAAKAAEAEVA